MPRSPPRNLQGSPLLAHYLRVLALFSRLARKIAKHSAISAFSRREVRSLRAIRSSVHALTCKIHTYSTKGSKIVANVLSRDKILASKDLRREWIATPEWAEGDPESGVYVRELTDAERSRFEREVLQGSSMNGNQAQGFNPNAVVNMRARLAVICVVDQDGDPIFESSDIGMLSQKSATLLSRIADVIFRLSGFTTEDQAKIEGNSTAPKEDSSIA